MDAVRKVQRCGAGDKVNYLPARRKHIYIVAEEILANAFNKFLCGIRIVFKLQRLPQPRKLAVQLVLIGAPFFIHPVRRYAVFARAVHFICSYLHLERQAGIGKQRCVQRPVHIGLWHGYIILEPAGHGLPYGMDYAKRRIAIVYRVHYNAHGYKVIYLRKVPVLPEELFIYAV